MTMQNKLQFKTIQLIWMSKSDLWSLKLTKVLALERGSWRCATSVERRRLLKTYQDMWKLIILRTFPILATSVEQFPGQEIVLDIINLNIIKMVTLQDQKLLEDAHIQQSLNFALQIKKWIATALHQTQNSCWTRLLLWETIKLYEKKKHFPLFLVCILSFRINMVIELVSGNLNAKIRSCICQICVLLGNNKGPNLPKITWFTSKIPWAWNS